MQYKCKYFKISELVHPDVLAKFGEANCWVMLDPDMLRWLDFLRDRYGPVMVNGNGLVNGGLRPYTATTFVSQHCLGRAFDAKIMSIENKGLDKKAKGAEYAKVRKELLALKDFDFVRYEMTVSGEPITWLHGDKGNRVSQEFNA